MSRDGLTREGRAAQRQQRLDTAYEVLNHAEHHPLGARLEAVAAVLQHGTAGFGDSAALDRMAQGIAYIAEALADNIARRGILE